MKTWALVAYRALSDAAGKGAFLLVTLVAARMLQQDGFGLFSIGTTVGWMAAVASDFGIQLHLARAVAQGSDDAGWLLRRWLRVRLWTSAAALVIVAVVLESLGATGQTRTAVLLFTTVYVVNGLVEFVHYFFRGLSRSDIESTIVLAQRGAMVILAVSALLWRPTLGTLGVAMLAPALAALWFALLKAKALAHASSMPYELRGASGNDAGAVEREQLRSELFRHVLPLGAGIVLSAFYFRIDLLLVGWWNGSEAAGLYNAAFRLIEALRLFPAAVLAVATPVLFRAGDRQPLLRVAAAVTLPALAASAVLWAVGPWLMPLLYGAPYAPASAAFRILAWSFPLMSLNYALTHQLIGWHGQRTYAWLCAVALAFNIGANASLIPAWGFRGAAWTTLWTEALLSAGLLAALARRGQPSAVTALSGAVAVEP